LEPISISFSSADTESQIQTIVPEGVSPNDEYRIVQTTSDDREFQYPFDGSFRRRQFGPIGYSNVIDSVE
jgi:hypothetical protein